MQVQCRLRKGESTTAVVGKAVAPPHTVRPQDPVFVRLGISQDGRVATAWGAFTGTDDWVLIDQRTFDTPLVLQGFAASSHGGGPVMFLAGGVGGGLPDWDRQALIGG